MALMQQHDVVEEPFHQSQLNDWRRQLGRRGFLVAAFVHGLCRTKTVIDMMASLKLKFTSKSYGNDAYAFQKAFRVDEHIGDRTVELSGLSKSNFAAGSRVLEKVHALLQVLDTDVAYGLPYRDLRAKAVTVDDVGVFSAKNVAASCARFNITCDDVNLSNTDDTHDQEDWKFFGSNPRDMFCEFVGGCRKSDIEQYFVECKCILNGFQDIPKTWLTAHTLLLNSCKAMQTQKNFEQGTIPSAKLRLGPPPKKGRKRN
jgi:hypothetical protein